MNSKTVFVMRPNWLELSMIFAAGVCVGRYSKAMVPTKAEKITGGDIMSIDQSRIPVTPSSVTETVERKPLFEYADGKLSFNLRR